MNFFSWLLLFVGALFLLCLRWIHDLGVRERRKLYSGFCFIFALLLFLNWTWSLGEEDKKKDPDLERFQVYKESVRRQLEEEGGKGKVNEEKPADESYDEDQRERQRYAELKRMKARDPLREKPKSSGAEVKETLESWQSRKTKIETDRRRMEEENDNQLKAGMALQAARLRARERYSNRMKEMSEREDQVTKHRMLSESRDLQERLTKVHDKGETKHLQILFVFA